MLQQPKGYSGYQEKSSSAPKKGLSTFESDTLLNYQSNRPSSYQKSKTSTSTNYPQIFDKQSTPQQAIHQRTTKQNNSDSQASVNLNNKIVSKNHQSFVTINNYPLENQTLRQKVDQYLSPKQPLPTNPAEQKTIQQKSPYYQNANQLNSSNKKFQTFQSNSISISKLREQEQKDLKQKQYEEIKHRVHTENDYQEEQTLAQKKKQLGYKKGMASYDQIPTCISVSRNTIPSFSSTPSTLISPLLNQLIQASTQSLEATKYSNAKCGILRNYAANTYQGLVRNYNEDRVSIIVNVNNQNFLKAPTSCSYFAVYDGHGGHTCSDYLRDNLHLHIIKDHMFLNNPREAIKKGFTNTENAFIQKCVESSERSGSCAVSILIIGDTCYVANVGDSRAILSVDGGKQVVPLTKDHKPNEELERQRITNAGGKIYQSQISSQGKIVLGPHRVLPGRLSVTRSFGDIEAKFEQFGGKQNVIIADPDIIQFKIQDNHDFIILASDGIFDKVSNEEAAQIVWETQNMPYFKNRKVRIHEFGAQAIENIMKFSLHRRTLDNITVVLESQSFSLKKSKSIRRRKSILKNLNFALE